jgi:hypothetical protein
MIWLVVAERLVVTGTAAFSLGAVDAGSHDGFTPGGHFDLGATFGKFRIAGELDAGMWSNEDIPEDQAPEAGAYLRVGGSLRYYFWDLDVGNQTVKDSLLRLYVEGGIGRQAIETPSLRVERPDLAIGFGMQQQIRFSSVTLGGTFGIRVLVSEAPPPNTPNIACKGDACDPPGYRLHDLGVFLTMGFAVGR